MCNCCAITALVGIFLAGGVKTNGVQLTFLAVAKGDTCVSDSLKLMPQPAGHRAGFEADPFGIRRPLLDHPCKRANLGSIIFNADRG
jgi:hypothetical protein